MGLCGTLNSGSLLGVVCTLVCRGGVDAGVAAAVGVDEEVLLLGPLETIPEGLLRDGITTATNAIMAAITVAAPVISAAMMTGSRLERRGLGE
jgi:hypothetical protein